MTAYQPRRARNYSGFIVLESQPRNWIKKHRSFASYDFLYGQVRFGQWTNNHDNDFFIETKVIEGIKPIIVLIKLELLADKVRVYHCHCQHTH